MNSMTKRIPVRKNTTGNREQNAEEESSASEGERETVGRPTGKTPDTQNVQDITETVMEKRTMEEIPPSNTDAVYTKEKWYIKNYVRSATAEREYVEGCNTLPRSRRNMS